MAQVELPKGIAAIHGRVGDYVFKTQGKKTFVYYMPKAEKLVSRKRQHNDSETAAKRPEEK